MLFNRFMLTTLGSAAIGLCSLSSSAEAILASVKTFGMAATGVAYPIDALAAAFNPAGHVEICDRLDLGITWSRDTGHARVHGNVLDTSCLQTTQGCIPWPVLLGGNVNGRFNGFKTRNFFAPDFGINKRFGCDNEWAIGLVVYNRNFSKTTYNKPFVLFGTSDPGLEYLHETISPVIAYRLNECHNFGLSVNFMVERLKANGLEKLDHLPIPFAIVGGQPVPGRPLGTVKPGHLTNKGYDWATGVSFTLGWQWHILPNLTFGLTYQPETNMSRFKKYEGFLAGKGKLNVPAMYSTGIAWTVWDCVTLAFDYQRYEWKDVKPLHNPLLHKGQVQQLGSSHGPGFGFRSQNFFRFGVNWQINESFAVRAGFRTANTPIRKSQTVVNQFTLDTVENFLTLGATYTMNCEHEFSTFFAYGFENTVKGKNSIPAGIPVQIPGQVFGFGGGESDLSASKYAVGLSWGWHY